MPIHTPFINVWCICYVSTRMSFLILLCSRPVYFHEINLIWFWSKHAVLNIDHHLIRLIVPLSLCSTLSIHQNILRSYLSSFHFHSVNFTWILLLPYLSFKPCISVTPTLAFTQPVLPFRYVHLFIKFCSSPFLINLVSCQYSSFNILYNTFHLSKSNHIVLKP